jgi:hypothetical protein
MPPRRNATPPRRNAAEKAGQPDSLLKFFQSAPAGGLVLDLKRKRDKTRKIRSFPTR